MINWGYTLELKTMWAHPLRRAMSLSGLGISEEDVQEWIDTPLTHHRRPSCFQEELASSPEVLDNDLILNIFFTTYALHLVIVPRNSTWVTSGLLHHVFLNSIENDECKTVSDNGLFPTANWGFRLESLRRLLIEMLAAWFLWQLREFGLKIRSLLRYWDNKAQWVCNVSDENISKSSCLCADPQLMVYISTVLIILNLCAIAGTKQSCSRISCTWLP